MVDTDEHITYPTSQEGLRNFLLLHRHKELYSPSECFHLLFLHGKLLVESSIVLV